MQLSSKKPNSGGHLSSQPNNITVISGGPNELHINKNSNNQAMAKPRGPKGVHQHQMLIQEQFNYPPQLGSIDSGRNQKGDGFTPEQDGA